MFALSVYCKWSGGLIREGLLTLTCFPGPQITTRVTTQASTSSSLPQTKPARTTTPPDDSSEEDATPPLPPAAAFSLQSQGEKGPARPTHNGDELAFKPTCGCENLMTCLHRLWNLHPCHEMSGSLQSAGVCLSRLIRDVWGIFKWSEGSHKASGVIFTARFLTFLFVLLHFNTKIVFVCF